MDERSDRVAINGGMAWHFGGAELCGDCGGEEYGWENELGKGHGEDCCAGFLGGLGGGVWVGCCERGCEAEGNGGWERASWGEGRVKHNSLEGLDMEKFGDVEISDDEKMVVRFRRIFLVS